MPATLRRVFHRMSAAALISLVLVAAEHRLSGPYTHENLTVFLIHGEDRLKGRKIITLSQALAEKKVIVHETGDVGQLQIENSSKDVEVFLQSGDIVKGGRQDRVITLSTLLSPKSGKIPVESFCVEQGRWSQRSGESATEFNASENMLNSKKLKLAARHEKSQGEVWKNVAESQDKISQNIGKNVKSGKSESSLELTLNDKELGKKTDEYLAKLEPAPAKQEDVVGFAFAINGKMNTAEIYASPRIFNMLWKKLIRSSAVEAIADRAEKNAGAAAISEADVRKFLTVKGEKKVTAEVAKTKMSKIVAQDRVYIEAAAPDGIVLHESFH
jgi:hypothetical protein